MNDGPALHVPPRVIPVPQHLSEAAQAVLTPVGAEGIQYPALDDLDGWRDLIAQLNAMALEWMTEHAPQIAVDIEEIDVGDVGVYVITPVDASPADRRTFLYVHGGGLIVNAGERCRLMGLDAVRQSRVPTWAVDYRMPPDHPYPTPVSDCVAAYRALLAEHRPEEIVIGGDSAGANLAAAAILRGRDEGLPLPAAAVLISPQLDLTESGDSFATNLGVDNVLGKSLMPSNLLYADGHDLSHPYLSPLFGDFSLGFPPTVLTAGTRDLFLSNAVRMHRRLRSAGIDAELHVLEAAPHGMFFFTEAPERLEVEHDIRRFCSTHWGSADLTRPMVEHDGRVPPSMS